MPLPLLIQMEIALHAADCKKDPCPGHGEKYAELAEAASAVLPPEREPWWLRDRKMIQETSLDLIIKRLDAIEALIRSKS